MDFMDFDDEEREPKNNRLKTIAMIVGILAGIATVVGVIFSIVGDKEPTPEPTIIAEETQKEDIETTTETQMIDEELPVTEAPTEPPTTEAPTEPAPTEPPTVYLDSLKITESYDFLSRNSVTDSIGNNYMGHFLYTHASGYTVYYLGGKYTTLSGIIAVSDESDNNTSGQVTILADDNPAYSTEAMGRVSTPVEFSVSVENCQWLKIESSGDYWCFFILADWKLQ